MFLSLLMLFSVVNAAAQQADTNIFPDVVDALEQEGDVKPEQALFTLSARFLQGSGGDDERSAKPSGTARHAGEAEMTFSRRHYVHNISSLASYTLSLLNSVYTPPYYVLYRCMKNCIA